jgi:hypothetical protein
MARAIVLAAFGSGRAQWVARRNLPRVLIATDVAAEGLDLQAGGHVVHVDLPWTPMRLQQREGRLLRLGQMHSSVGVTMRTAAPPIESALAAMARIRRKQDLGGRWLDALEHSTLDIGKRVVRPAIAVAIDSCAASTVAVRLGDGARNGAIILARTGDGEWRPVTGPVHTPNEFDISSAHAFGDLAHNEVAELAAAAREALSLACRPDGASRALVSRVHLLARRAAVQRDASTLDRLDRLLRFATHSPTLGARMIIADLLQRSDRELLAAIVPDMPRRSPVQATPIAAVLFRSTDAPLR